jgi:prevent-host-death family protein
MKELDVFTARDLRNNTGELIKDAENGIIAIITKHGKPKVLAIPFDYNLLNLGVNKSLALHLFEKKLIPLSLAAKIAQVSIEDFLDMLKELDINVVDHPAQEMESDLDNILS